MTTRIPPPWSAYAVDENRRFTKERYDFQQNRDNAVSLVDTLAGGKIWIGSAANLPAAQTPSGDATVTAGGVFTLQATANTTEIAQDAAGAMVDATLVYVDATPLLTRAALTGDISAAQASNTTVLATVNANVGTFGSAANVGQFTVNGKGL